MANRPYILVYKDPLLIHLLVSVPSILTLRYTRTFQGIPISKSPSDAIIFPAVNQGLGRFQYI